MNLERMLLAVAGSAIVLSILLGNLLHPYWYALGAFLGADLAQAAITGYSPLAALLRKIGLRCGAVFGD
jgi:Inner membrane protein YgaP-like, transmembrane domain